ncbi:ABC-three component system protein [Actinokineospora sp. 24-640]
MSDLSSQDRAWFHSQFLALCARKSSFEWQGFVTDIMLAKHGGSFIQVDPGGRGDKGCDGWVDDLMLACYGATSPDPKYVTKKIRTDFETARLHWADAMKRWAFVYNNAAGLPVMVAEGIIALKRLYKDKRIEIENWPPQVLWNETCRELSRDKLSYVLGAPPSDHPAGMSYIARCVESLARTRLASDLDPVVEVPFGKIEHNRFSEDLADLIKRFQVHTGHVRYYFSKASPGEQAQVSEILRSKFDGLRATLPDSDSVFHALCDDLIKEAFVESGELKEREEQRNAAVMVVTHFFERCEIFEAPGVA